MFATRFYNNLVVDFEKGTILKTSKNPRLEDEGNYYQLLPENLKIHFPRCLSSGKYDDGEYYLNLEYYPYENFGNAVFAGLPSDSCLLILDKLKKVLAEFSFIHDVPSCEAREKMFIQKTQSEHLKYGRQSPLFDLSQPIILNDVVYQPFEKIWDGVEDLIRNHLLDNDDQFSVIHGDLCFSNILIHKYLNSENYIIKLIDPRGSFGNPGVIGDPVYDLAKLHHSIFGAYEYIINNRFSFHLEGQNLAYNLTNDNLLPLQNHFINSYPTQDVFRAKLVSGLIFIGMCARHCDSPRRQSIMYATGLKFLNECLWD